MLKYDCDLSFNVILGIVICILIALLSRQWFRVRMYDKVPILFPNGKDGDIFLIHVDDDIDHFKILNNMLERTDPKFKKENRKYLRGRKYTTLYHERDFVAGELITVNIKNCVNKCQKAFILLSPSLLKSQWCRDEFVIAQSQDKAIFIKLKLNEAQENELNELLLKPENAPIKLNLETRTYLKWSGAINDKQFWRWVAYLLPHKQPESNDDIQNNLKKYLCCFRTSICAKKRRKIDGNDINHIEEQGPLIEQGPNPLSDPPAVTPNETNEIQLNTMTQNSTNTYNGDSRPTQTSTVSTTSGTASLQTSPMINGENTKNPGPLIDRNVPSHENEVWYHPDFRLLSDATFAMLNRTSMEGTFMITNLPEDARNEKRSYGIEIGSYIILRGGAKSRDVSSYMIRVLFLQNEMRFALAVKMDEVFKTLHELVQHFKQNPLPGINNKPPGKLSEPFQQCTIHENKRCKRCSSRQGD